MESETIVDITEAVETNDESILEDVDFSGYIVFIEDNSAVRHLVSKGKEEVDIEKILLNYTDEIIYYDEGKKAYYFQLELPSKSGKVKRYGYKKLITKIRLLKCPDCGSEMRHERKIRNRIDADGKAMKILVAELFCKDCCKSQEIFFFKAKNLATLFYYDVRTALSSISKIGIGKDGFIIERFQ